MAVAVIGTGSRLPGAENTNDYWRLLVRGENHVKDIPETRWHDRNKSSRTRAGLVEGSEKEWDYEFHGITSYESREMDPQQKMVLDCVYMALENAGLTREQVKSSNTSVFIGAMNSDYKNYLGARTGESINYQMTGSSNSILSARVSHVFDFRGNSVTVDSACSSSAVAIDLACNQLLSGKCEMAVVGGVNSILSPDFSAQLLKVGMVSPTGTCNVFSDKADGYVRGEGCGIVILKTIDQAKRNNDRVLATIITGTNQDGATVSPITAPSVEQQVRLMENIYKTNGISPDTVDYVETHGTGTPVGDPVEAEALARFFQRTNSSQSLLIGSVKTNIGHLESASGVVSLIKVILMHYHQTLVPTLNYDRPSKAIRLSEKNLEVVTEVRPWPSSDRTFLRSAVNCFGFGGTNCHMIVTTDLSSTASYQMETVCEAEVTDSIPRIACLSAKNPVALKRMVDDLCDDGSGYSLENLSYTSIKRRKHYEYRASVVGRTVDEVKQSFKSSSTESNTTTAQGNHIIFVFAGVGTSWLGMCRQLLTKSEVFRSTIIKINTLLQKHVEWNLMEKLDTNIDEEFFHAGVNSLLIFAVEVALFSTLTEVGVKPDAVLGQSMGEVAAAFASGLLQLEQAVDIMYCRTKCLEKATGGNMFFVKGIPEDKVISVLGLFDNRACISLYYSPISFVISCDADLCHDIKAKLLEEEANVQFTDLKLTTAFHSYHVDNSVRSFRDSLDVEFNGSDPKIPIYSTVTGEPFKENDFTSLEYWVKNIREPVLFHQAVRSSHKPGKNNIYIEVGPKPVLTPFLDGIFDKQQSAIGVPTINSGDDLEHFLKSIARLYQHGVEIILKDCLDPSGQLIDVPRYKFNPRPSQSTPSVPYQHLNGVDTTDFLHRFVRPVIDDRLAFKIFLNHSEIPSIFTHSVHENKVIPGALYAEAGLAIWLFVNGFCIMEACEVSVSFLKPVVLKDNDMKFLDVSVDDSSHAMTFSITDGRLACATGKIQPPTSKSRKLYLDDIKDRCGQTISAVDVYSYLSRVGFSYGKKMALLRNCMRNSYEALSEMEITDLRDELGKTVLHPAIIDGLIQTVSLFMDNHEATNTELYPVAINRLVVFSRTSEHMVVYTKLLKEDEDFLSLSVDLCTNEGLIVASIQEVLFRFVNFNSSALKRFQKISWKKLDEATMLHVEGAAGDDGSPLLALVACSERDKIDREGLYFISTDENQRKGQLNELKLTNRHISVVIVLPTETIDVERISGEILEDSVTEIMLWLKDIFLFVTENLNVTKAAVLIPIHETNSTELTSANLIPTAVSGFLRSVQKEVHFRLHIIHTDETSPNIHKIRNLLTSPKMEGETEFIVKQNEIRSCRCEALSNEDGDCVEIRPTQPRTGMEVFVDEQKAEFIMYRRRHSKEIKDPQILKVSTMVFQKPDLFSPFVRCELHEEKIIFSKFCLEALGRIESETSRSEVVSFYPVHGSDELRVPNACCIPLEMFHGQYMPGMLTALVILWNLSRLINKSNVLVLYSDNNEVAQVDILLSMLGDRNLKTCKLRNTMNGICGKVDQIISLVRVDNQRLVNDIRSCQNAEIITLSALVPEDFQSSLYYGSGNVTALTDHDMFKPQRLTTLLPELLSWLTTVGVGTLQEMKYCMSHKTTPFLRLINDRQISEIDEMRMLPLRLERSKLICGEALYVVVGGLTGLGWECVKWLAENEAAVVVCFNRRTPSLEDTKKMRELFSRYRCSIVAVSTDVTDMESVNKSMLTLKEQFPTNPLRGVFYGAAVINDATMSNIHRKNIQPVLAPKVRGLWNIHQITKEEDLDFFILHSSITSVLGNSGQTVYGCANAFMDGFVEYRRSLGLPAQSINWGPLDMGMLESDEAGATRKRLVKEGYKLIMKEDVGSCLERAIISDQPQMTVADLTNNIQEVDIYTKSKLRDQVAFQHYFSSKESNIDEAVTDLSVDINTLRNKPMRERLVILQSIVLEIAKRALGFNVTLESNLHDSGIDSLKAMTMRNEIFKITMYSIPLAILQNTDVTVMNVTENVNNHMCPDTNDLDEAGKNYAENLTYMERRYLKLNDMPNVYKSLHFITDFQLGGFELKYDILKKIVEMVLERNGYARAIFPTTGNGDQRRKKTIVKAAQALKIFHVKEDKEEAIDEKKFLKFDMNSDGPVRFVLRTENDTTRIIIITHDSVFDRKTTAQFLNEFLKCLQHIIYDEKIDEPKLDPNLGKTAVEILESALKNNVDDLRHFWRDQLKQGIPNVSIDAEKILTQTSGLSVVSHRSLPKDLYRRLKGVPRTTAPKVIISMYQLLLGYLSSSRRVCVTFPQDVRIPLPEFTDHLGCLTNNVPLFADIPDDHVQIMEFLHVNSKSIALCADVNGYFPFEDLADVFPEGTPRDNVDVLLRHCVTYNDRSFMYAEAKRAADYNVQLEFLNIGSEHSYCESDLYINEDKTNENIVLTLHLNKDMHSKAKANDVLSKLLKLLEANFESSTIGDQRHLVSSTF